MRYAKALLAAVIAAAGAIAAGLQDGALSVGDVWLAAGALVVAAGGAWGVPNAGFLDLSKLTAEQRAELGRFLNLK